MIQKFVSRLVIFWISIIMITISCLYDRMNKTGANFYRFGPHDNFLVIGIKINTPVKYFFVIFYCFINSLIRNILHNILKPWLINNVQDINVVKPDQIKFLAYEVTYVVTIYNWVDWYVYMNLLLAQVDMFLTEMLADVFMSGIVTYYYLNIRECKKEELDEVEEIVHFEDVNNPMFLEMSEV
jgi:hypothetical protein